MIQGCLRAAENMQLKLTEELHATRDTLREEFFGELATNKEQLESAMCCVKSSLLSASVAEFVSSADGHGAGTVHMV